MTTIFSLDLGTTTGWALRAADGRITSGSQSFKPGRFEGGGMRYLRFKRWLTEVKACSDGIGEVLRVYREKVVADYAEARDLRSRLPYEIDGVVVKVDDVADVARIPSKRRAPGHALVHKPVPWIAPLPVKVKFSTLAARV